MSATLRGVVYLRIGRGRGVPPLNAVDRSIVPMIGGPRSWERVCPMPTKLPKVVGGQGVVEQSGPIGDAYGAIFVSGCQWGGLSGALDEMLFVWDCIHGPPLQDFIILMQSRGARRV